jgi:hypothetical protein
MVISLARFVARCGAPASFVGGASSPGVVLSFFGAGRFAAAAAARRAAAAVGFRSRVWLSPAGGGLALLVRPGG